MICRGAAVEVGGHKKRHPVWGARWASTVDALTNGKMS